MACLFNAARSAQAEHKGQRMSAEGGCRVKGRRGSETHFCFKVFTCKIIH